MKTKEQLSALREEARTVSRKLEELTDEELAQVFGGDKSEITFVLIRSAASWGTADAGLNPPPKPVDEII